MSEIDDKKRKILKNVFFLISNCSHGYVECSFDITAKILSIEANIL